MLQRCSPTPLSAPTWRLKMTPATWRRGFISLTTKVSLNKTWNMKVFKC